MQEKTPTKALPKANSAVVVFGALWSFFKFLFFPVLVLLIALELFTPSLYFPAGVSAKPYTSDIPVLKTTFTGYNGTGYPVWRTALLTHDYRNLKVDYFVPPQGVGSGPIPITIIISGFMTPEWLVDRVAPRGFDAVVLYRSPRQERMAGPYWPSLSSLSNATKISDYWNFFATNPLNKLYSIHASLHEAPGDISDIVMWARSNMSGDIGRINLIGLGSGALIAAAAADKLQAIGMPARTLTLIYPPANLKSAIADNLVHTPSWLRSPLASALNLLYFRLHLDRHLPKISGTQKLLVIPRNSYDLATYAAEPAIALAGPDTSIEYLDVGYTGYYVEDNATKVRNIVGRWLLQQGAVSSY